VLQKKLRRLVCGLAPVVVAGALLSGVTSAQAEPGHTSAVRAARPASPAKAAPDRISDPGSVLPSGWHASPDRAVAVAGDGSGLHVLVADASSGYTWRTVATLQVRGTDTSQWIGQACLTAGGSNAVVVYAPREITNVPDALGFGALAAVVNLSTGKVTQVGAGVSIAYFDPGCGTGQDAVLTQGGTGASPVAGPLTTRLLMLNAVTGKVAWSVRLPGQVTSAVPFGGQMAAVSPHGVVSINHSGRARVLAAARGQAFRLVPDARGGLGFLVAAGKRVQVRRYAAGRDQLVGSAALGSVELSQVSGHVFVTGEHASGLGRMPAAWRALDVLAGADMSSTGMLAITLASTGLDAKGSSLLARTPDTAQPVRITAQIASTGKAVAFTAPASETLAGTVLPTALPPFPAGQAASGTAAAKATTPRSDQVSPPPSNVNPATTTYDPDRSCSVPRNDPNIQTYQPSAAQIEWAADEAVQGDLTTDESANLYGSGLPAYSPQGLFKPPGLDGGGSVPAQVLLGIMVQESNFDQASSHAIIGQTGNFEPSYNWYGDGGTYTYVDWADADCGYGIAQITSGMCLSGYAGCTSPLSYEDQLAIAVDYEANIAAGLQILEQKWNQLYGLGILANGGNPKYIEDWWFALWAYNSGLEPDAANGNTTGCSPSPTCTDAPGNGSGGNWGLGWVDNPANPMYPPDRPMFLEQGPSGTTYNYDWDEAHPGGWSYEEKVIGFAAYGFFPYNYVAGANQLAFDESHYPDGQPSAPLAQPPYSEFCADSGTDNNHCDPADVGTDGACQLSNDHCWWHEPISWDSDCAGCGVQTLAYGAGAANPGSPGVPAGYGPVCSSSPLPSSDAVIVGDTASSIPKPLGCGTSWSNNGGTMTFNFAAADTSPATYPSKIDFHQIGSDGYGAHYWFTHTIPSDQVTPTAPISTVPSSSDADLEITGTWTPPESSVAGWTRIMAAIPNEGAWDPQANYQINLGNGTSQHRIVNQAYQSDTWVDLGIYDLSPGASVSLTNVTFTGLGYDIAWDAMAFIPVSAPGADYVAIGDSFSSGEGLQPFDANSDYNYDGMVDACHRSGNSGSDQAFPALVTLPGQSSPIAKEAESASGNTQFMLLACASDYTTEMAVQSYDKVGTDGSTGVPGGTVAQAPMANTVWNTYSLGYNELPQASTGWLTGKTTLVTVTAGGDDGRLASVLIACLLSNPFNDCTASGFYMLDRITNKVDPEPLYEYEPAVLNALEPHLVALYEAIAKAAPNAEVIVLGYPDLFAGDTSAGPCDLDVQGFSLPVIPSDVTSWLNKMGDLLDTNVQNAVAAAADADYNVHFINPNSAFSGHEVCSANPWINGIIASSESGSSGGVPQVPGIGSFHPNAAGQQEFATLVDECLAHTIEC
jgi:Transglycosylase SLT domain